MGAAATALVAFLGLLGYLPGLRIIGSLRSDYIPMAITTACCFLVLAAVLFLQARKPRLGFGRMLVKMLSQQLGGSFAIANHAGVRCTVEFDI